MSDWLQRQLRDLREGGQILASREFWRTFTGFYSPAVLAARMDDWASARRERSGQNPDWNLERRRRQRHAALDSIGAFFRSGRPGGHNERTT
jgi:hypothetical protein